MRAWRTRPVRGVRVRRACIAVCLLLAVCPVARAQTIKPVLVGLLDRGVDDPTVAWHAPPVSYLGSPLAAYAVDIGWNELEPTPRGPIAANTRLGRALAQVRSFNASHPTTPIRLRLRVFAGVDTPAWAMSLDGPPMVLRCDNIPVPFRCFAPGPHTATVPRFWGPNYGRAYSQLMTKLAVLYDKVPEIAEIVVSKCSTFYPETFLRQFYLPGNASAYIKAGWTSNADAACMQSEIDVMKTTWPNTRVGLALNPLEILDPSTMRASQDVGPTLTMMRYCRRALATRCVLENYSTRTPTLGGLYPAMYRGMVALGRPLAYQTAIDSRVGDLNATLTMDTQQLAADDIELPRGYDDPTNRYVYRTPAQLVPYARALH